jgi:hypothetical protein
MLSRQIILRIFSNAYLLKIIGGIALEAVGPFCDAHVELGAVPKFNNLLIFPITFVYFQVCVLWMW